MKKIALILTTAFLFSFNVYAKNGDSLDVFEEFAVAELELVCEDMFIETYKNTSVDGVLKFRAEGSVTVEIVSNPKKGSVTLTNEKGGFTYTPEKDWVGTDSFQFRISKGTESSNISYCGITIKEQEQAPSEPWFVYEDMRTHWANYSAVKLVEEDILKGERIGNRYYFHPETKMRRIDVIEYILAALKADFSEVDKNETHIFADSAELPEYINYAAYLANKIGFVEGKREGEDVYLRPYEYINRAEIIRMIDIAMGSKTRSDVEINFDDSKNIPGWAMQSVKNLVGYGIIKGFEDNTLRPYDNITKAQTAEMIYQMLKYNRTAETFSMRIKHENFGRLIA